MTSDRQGQRPPGPAERQVQQVNGGSSWETPS
jgi:hypothetical protein